MGIDEITKNLDQVLSEITDLINRQQIADKQNLLQDLKQQSLDEDFWKDNIKAQEISKQIADLGSEVDLWQELANEAAELQELAGLEGIKPEEIEVQLKKIIDKLEKAKRDLRFDGPYDKRDAIIGIFAGAGGLDAQDWAQMLLRMYGRWVEKQGGKIVLTQESRGDEAGLKSAQIEITGVKFAYGKLKHEHGVHRLVRLSPFNADNLRQTSFARVEVMPVIAEPQEIDIPESDLRVDVYRSSGKGGQSVNTTDSAVRITHLPTGVVVAIQNERSQIQNRETAMKILRSRLAQLMLQQHAQKLEQVRGPAESAEWGNQIRNYVLHPYQLVKDVRSGVETSDIGGVLDGDIDAFLEVQL